MRRQRHYIIVGPSIDVYGDTYPLRTRLKDMGGRFQGGSKAWRVPHSPENLESLLAMGFVPQSEGGGDDPGMGETGEGLQEGTSQSNSADLTVSELCDRIDIAIRGGLPTRFWLLGELTHVQHSRGHVWLEIADAAAPDGSAQKRRASVQGVIFADTLRKLESQLSKLRGERLPLESGLQVRVAGRLSFWQEGARLSLVIDEVDQSYTAGRLALDREKILAELRRKRLLERNASVPWSPFPLRVALITANESRARNDFLHELGQTGLPFSVTLYDCRMQGESTSQEVVRALTLIGESKEPTGVLRGEGNLAFDIVVITRGGGSRMDLRWFDDLPIALAIAQCPLPVVTAIGHHDDQSIADLVAAISEKTPTAAAQHLGSHCARTLEELNLRMGRAAGRAQRRLTREHEALTRLTMQIRRAALSRLERETQRLDAAERLLSFAKRQIAGVLERGYALPWDSEGRAPLRVPELLEKKPTELLLELRAPGGEEVYWLPVRPDWAGVRVEAGPSSGGASGAQKEGES